MGNLFSACTSNESDKDQGAIFYNSHPEAVIISCYFNPKNSEYRRKNYLNFHDSIRHCNHRIIECAIGEDSQFELPESEFVRHVRTDNLLWHKETLLNLLIKELPKSFKYVFWVC